MGAERTQSTHTRHPSQNYSTAKPNSRSMNQDSTHPPTPAPLPRSHQAAPAQPLVSPPPMPPIRRPQQAPPSGHFRDFHTEEVDYTPMDEDRDLIDDDVAMFDPVAQSGGTPNHVLQAMSDSLLRQAQQRASSSQQLPVGLPLASHGHSSDMPPPVPHRPPFPPNGMPAPRRHPWLKESEQPRHPQAKEATHYEVPDVTMETPAAQKDESPPPPIPKGPIGHGKPKTIVPNDALDDKTPSASERTKKTDPVALIATPAHPPNTEPQGRISPHGAAKKPGRMARQANATVIKDDFFLIDQSAIIKVEGANPNSSPIQLRIFALPNSAIDSAVKALQSQLELINVSKEGAPLLPQSQDWLDPKWFFVTEGEPAQNVSDSNTFHSCACITFSAAGKSTIENKVETMDRLRRRLQEERGLEAYWSCGDKTDRRAVGEFIFRRKDPNQEDTITDLAASTFIRQKCSQLGATVHRDWGNLKYSIDNRRNHVRHARFHSVRALLDMDSTAPTWEWEDYHVTFHRSFDFIDPKNPCSIVVHGVGGYDPSTILAEVFNWIEEFNARYNVDEGITDDATPVLSKWFVCHPTSFALAVYICQQTPRLFQPWQLVYDINRHDMLTTELRKRREANQERMSKERTNTALSETSNAMLARLDRLEDRQMAFAMYSIQKQEEMADTIQASQVWTNTMMTNNQQIFLHSSNTQFLKSERAQAKKEIASARNMQLRLSMMDTPQARQAIQEAKNTEEDARQELQRIEDEIFIAEQQMKAIQADTPPPPPLRSRIELPASLRDIQGRTQPRAITQASISEQP